MLQRVEMQTDAVVPPPGCVCIKSCRVETSRGGEDPVTQFEPRRKAIGLQIDIGLWSSADQCSLAAERGIECYLLLQIVLKNQFLIMCSVEKECKSEDPCSGIWSQVFKYHKMRNSMSMRRLEICQKKYTT